MHLEEDAIDARPDRRACEQRNEFRLTARDAVGSGRNLHGMGSIEDDGGEGAHDGERAHVHNEVVVAEGRATLGEKDAGVAGGCDFFDGVAHVPGRDELAFFDVDGAAGAAGGDEQVGLAAQKRRNLEDVCTLGRDFTVRRLVHIGENWKAGGFGKAAQDGCAFDQARAAKTRYRGAIGLVVRGFEDVREFQIGRDALDGVRHGADV